MTRYDVIYEADRCYIEPHFCREWENGEGCYGTNPHHGFTKEEAQKLVDEYYRNIREEN